jgi:hypothetical protein
VRRDPGRTALQIARRSMCRLGGREEFLCSRPAPSELEVVMHTVAAVYAERYQSTEFNTTGTNFYSVRDKL